MSLDLIVRISFRLVCVCIACHVLKNKLGVQLCVASGNKSATDLAITDMDHKISALPGGAPLKDTHSDWLPDVALRVDVMILEQVEALEDKVANASMQVKVSVTTFTLLICVCVCGHTHACPCVCVFIAFHGSVSRVATGCGISHSRAIRIYKYNLYCYKNFTRKKKRVHIK